MSNIDKEDNGFLLRSKKFRTFKIIVIGDSNVGKTCLTFRFCEGKFPNYTEATIGVDFRLRKLNIQGEDIILQLWDTAGQERFRRSMVSHYYRNVHAVVFVYDVTQPDTFHNLSLWLDECARHNLNAKVARLMIGNKCDVEDAAMNVPTDVAQRLADTHHMPLFETSARSDSSSQTIEAIFVTLAHKLCASKPLMEAPTPTKVVRAEDLVIQRESTDAAGCC